MAKTALIVLMSLLLGGNAFGSARPQTEGLIANICAAVKLQSEELDPTHPDIMFQYQSLIASEAGVLPSDTKTQFNGKMGTWIDRNMPRLLCRGFDFSPQGGNILKLAISAQSDSFIDDVVRTWKVDLNQVDLVDGQTVLDYIEAKRVAGGSNANLNRIYTRYYDRFRAAGARHAIELR